MHERLTSRYVPENEAAIFLGMSKKALQAWRGNGTGPPFVKFGRAVRYNLDELHQWAESQQHASTASVTAGSA